MNKSTNTPAPAHEAVLTDDEILRAAINASDSLNITRVHEIGGPSRTIMEDAGLLELGRAVESALLSKLRAPVADERAASLQHFCLAFETFSRASDFGEAYAELERAYEKARAALASAPVAEPFDPEVLAERLRDVAASHYEAAMSFGISRDNFERCATDAAKIAQDMAGAPVAGEAVAWRMAWKGGSERKWRDMALEPPSTTQSLDGTGCAIEYAYAAPQASEAVRKQSAAFPTQPLGVFCAGKWTWSGTGQAFSHTDLDEAAFVAYRDALSAQPGAQKGGSDA